MYAILAYILNLHEVLYIYIYIYIYILQSLKILKSCLGQADVMAYMKFYSKLVSAQ